MSGLRKISQILALSAVCSCWAVTVHAEGDQAGAGVTPPTTPKGMSMMSMGGVKATKSADAPAVAITGDGKAEADLTMEVRRYDFAGTKTYNRMYMPDSAAFSPNKPENVTKEPHYNGTPKYAQITIGNGTPNQFTIVSDEGAGQEPKLYIDLNGDGDLTNDGTGEWTTKIPGSDGGLPNYQGTYTFKPGWRAANGLNTVGEYALNFYWQPGRERINYYNASARVGKITLDGKVYDVTLLENDSDGLYNKIYDHSKPIVIGEKLTKPVWLLLDGDQYDIRGTFGFGGMNYLATVTDDGSKITLAPTMKVVLPPRAVMEKTTMIEAGVAAPDFEALGWKPGQTKLDATNRFKLSDYRGKVVVVDMWATWCGPCMRGIPHLSKIAESVAGQDVVVIALNTSDDAIPFEAFANGKGKEYKFMLARDPAGRDPNGNTIARKLYGVTGIPATFVIDKMGKIVGTVSGYTEGDTKLQQILKGQGIKID